MRTWLASPETDEDLIAGRNFIAAAEALPPEQKEELLRFLTVRLRPANQSTKGASLVEGPSGTLLLEAPPGASPMNTETIRQMLEDLQ